MSDSDTQSSVLREIADTLRPRAAADAALPPLMILLTIVTGIVDAVAYLRLGHVFVANMTGNVVFLGFSAAGAPGLSVVGSLVAIACFLPGGVLAGRLAARGGNGRVRQLRTATGIQLLLFAGAILVAAPAGDHIGSHSRYALIVLLALAMGIQNATARRLAVTDLTTTVLTLTLTGIAADSKLAGGGSRPTRPTHPLGHRDAARRDHRRRTGAQGRPGCGPRPGHWNPGPGLRRLTNSFRPRRANAAAGSCRPPLEPNRRSD